VTIRRASLVLAFAVLLLFPPSTAPAQDTATRYIYRETLEGVESIKEYVLRQTETGWEMLLLRSDQRTWVATDPDFATSVEHYASLEYPEETIFHREGDVVHARGVFEGGDIDDEIEVDESPWYGSLLFLRHFVLSGEDRREFWVSEPTIYEFFKLAAIREEIETVQVGGSSVKTVRVRVTLPDFRSLFWSSTYWFRLVDGVLVKSEETRGRPGTPTTYVELMAEDRLPWPADLVPTLPRLQP
jgi:hypothetical protein